MITYKDKVISATQSVKVGLRTQGQMDYVRTVREYKVTICYGPAGTGKTYLAVASALEALNNRQVDKIIITRPAVDAGESLGFLPGEMGDKIRPYLQPIYDSLFGILDRDKVHEYNDKGIIEVATLAHMRGRTFNNAFMILDEAQNTKPSQMKMYLTRIGKNSKCVVVGDETQVDLYIEKNGLTDAINRLKPKPSIGITSLTVADIQRDPVVQDIVDAYDDERRTD